MTRHSTFLLATLLAERFGLSRRGPVDWSDHDDESVETVHLHLSSDGLSLNGLGWWLTLSAVDERRLGFRVAFRGTAPLDAREGVVACLLDYAVDLPLALGLPTEARGGSSGPRSAQRSVTTTTSTTRASGRRPPPGSRGAGDAGGGPERSGSSESTAASTDRATNSVSADGGSTTDPGPGTTTSTSDDGGRTWTSSAWLPYRHHALVSLHERVDYLALAVRRGEDPGVESLALLAAVVAVLAGNGPDVLAEPTVARWLERVEEALPPNLVVLRRGDVVTRAIPPRLVSVDEYERRLGS